MLDPIIKLLNRFGGIVSVRDIGITTVILFAYNNNDCGILVNSV